MDPPSVVRQIPPVAAPTKNLLELTGSKATAFTRPWLGSKLGIFNGPIDCHDGVKPAANAPHGDSPHDRRNKKTKEMMPSGEGKEGFIVLKICCWKINGDTSGVVVAKIEGGKETILNILCLIGYLESSE